MIFLCNFFYIIIIFFVSRFVAVSNSIRVFKFVSQRICFHSSMASYSFVKVLYVFVCTGSFAWFCVLVFLSHLVKVFLSHQVKVFLYGFAGVFSSLFSRYLCLILSDISVQIWPGILDSSFKYIFGLFCVQQRIQPTFRTEVTGVNKERQLSVEYFLTDQTKTVDISRLAAISLCLGPTQNFRGRP